METGFRGMEPEDRQPLGKPLHLGHIGDSSSEGSKLAADMGRKVLFVEKSMRRAAERDGGLSS